MKTIARFGSLEQAQLIKLKLESRGIEAFIPDDISATLTPHFFMTKSGVRVQVDEKDEEEARQILADDGDQADGDPPDSQAWIRT